MYLELLWLLLPIAAASGYYIAKREFGRSRIISSYDLPQDYYKGLNYILNEQPDKAIDIFLKLSEHDSTSLELHLSLGSLFRKRGEVDRAIRLHQSLLNHPSVGSDLYKQTLQELSWDYMSAGLLDRAEKLCLELLDVDNDNLAALRLLRELYQQEKEWFRAIEITRRIANCSSDSMSEVIAHYYCELADEARGKSDLAHAARMIEKSLAEDPKCARAIMAKAEMERQNGDYELAINSYELLEQRAPQYLSDVLNLQAICYQALGRKSQFVGYLRGILTKHHSVELVLTATRMLRDLEGETVAAGYLGKAVADRPSLRGIQYLLEFEEAGSANQHLQAAKSALDKLLLNKPVYRCCGCGFTGKEMHWCCPSCKRWSSIQPIQEFQWGASI